MDVNSYNAEASAINNDGIAYLSDKNTRHAIDSFIRACELEPDNGVWWNNLGYAQYKAGSVDNAIQSLSHALELDDRQIDAYLNLALCFEVKGDLPSAETILVQSLSCNASEATIYHRLASLYIKSNLIAEAAGCLEKVVEIAPSDLSGWISLCNLLTISEQYDLAAKVYGGALQVHVDNIDLLFGLGQVLQVQGNLNEANAIYKKIMDLDGSTLLGHIGIGYLQLQRKQYADAMKTFLAADDIEKNSMFVIFGLGLIALVNGENKKALEHATILKQNHYLPAAHMLVAASCKQSGDVNGHKEALAELKGIENDSSAHSLLFALVAKTKIGHPEPPPV